MRINILFSFPRKRESILKFFFYDLISKLLSPMLFASFIRATVKLFKFGFLFKIKEVFKTSVARIFHTNKFSKKINFPQFWCSKPDGLVAKPVR